MSYKETIALAEKGLTRPEKKIGQKIAEMENRYRAIGIAYLTEKE
jgi:hypothetical protein